MSYESKKVDDMSITSQCGLATVLYCQKNGCWIAPAGKHEVVYKATHGPASLEALDHNQMSFDSRKIYNRATAEAMAEKAAKFFRERSQ